MPAVKKFVEAHPAVGSYLAKIQKKPWFFREGLDVQIL